MPSTAADPSLWRQTRAVKPWQWPCYVLAVLLLGACDNQGNGPATQPRTLSVPADCVPQAGCRLQLGSLVVALKFGADAQALRPFPVQVNVESQSPVDAVGLAFSMRGMAMGQNHYQLIKRAPQRWEGSITLPVCVSGRSDWEATLRIATSAGEYQAQLPFVLRP